MSKNESFQFLVRLVEEREQDLHRANDAVIRAFVTKDAEGKRAAAEKALKAADNLALLVSPKDTPSWLPDFKRILTGYLHQPGWDELQFINNYYPIKILAEKHVWIFDEGDDEGLDFDSIFERYKLESRLPELFDEIVRILEEINESGEVDSLSMLNALSKVIATLKAGRDGSYFSLSSSWEFLINFLRNYMWVELANLPLIGGAMEALEKTIKEADEEMHKVSCQVRKEMSRVVEAEVKGLRGKSDFKLMTYTRAGHLVDGFAAPTTNVVA